MSIFKSVPLIRRSFQPGTYCKGQWQEGPYTDTPFRGTWQPAGGKTRELLPEGKRAGEVCKCFAPVTLEFTAADAEEGASGDMIVFEGKEYEITAAAKWGNGLLPHWELVCTRKKEGES
jgi:hypothetical protein